MRKYSSRYLGYQLDAGDVFGQLCAHVLLYCMYRGNSKYHYYGIRIKQQSLLNQFPEEDSLTVRQQSSGGLQKR